MLATRCQDIQNASKDKGSLYGRPGEGKILSYQTRLANEIFFVKQIFIPSYLEKLDGGCKCHATPTAQKTRIMAIMPKPIEKPLIEDMKRILSLRLAQIPFYIVSKKEQRKIK